MRTFKITIPIFAILSLLIWSGCKKDDDDNTPKADFSYSFTGNPGEVSFTNQSENTQVYEWDFGDEDKSTITSPTHTYDDNGDFVVLLKATGGGTTVSVSDTITVNNIP